MMPGRPGEIAPRKAAAVLEVHIRTIRRWCHEHRIDFRRDAAGRYWLQRAEIESIAQHPGEWRDGDAG